MGSLVARAYIMIEHSKLTPNNKMMLRAAYEQDTILLSHSLSGNLLQEKYLIKTDKIETDDIDDEIFRASLTFKGCWMAFLIRKGLV
jgi:hypothetical protein